MITGTITQNVMLFGDALPPLDRKTERAYLHIAQTSESEAIRRKARETLVRSNLRFLGAMAVKWANSLNQDAMDLAAEGRMHLLRAVDKYDLTKHSVRFLSFAAWDILNSFQEVRRRSRVLQGLPPGLESSNLVVSLDAELPNGEEGDVMTLGEMLRDDALQQRLESEESMQDARHTVRQLLQGLDPHLLDMLEKRFGMLPVSGGAPGEEVDRQSIVELAEARGVSPQVMGSAYHRTLRRLRSAHLTRP